MGQREKAVKKRGRGGEGEGRRGGGDERWRGEEGEGRKGGGEERGQFARVDFRLALATLGGTCTYVRTYVYCTYTCIQELAFCKSFSIEVDRLTKLLLSNVLAFDAFRRSSACFNTWDLMKLRVPSESRK